MLTFLRSVKIFLIWFLIWVHLNKNIHAKTPGAVTHFLMVSWILTCQRKHILSGHKLEEENNIFRRHQVLSHLTYLFLQLRFTLVLLCSCVVGKEGGIINRIALHQDRKSHFCGFFSSVISVWPLGDDSWQCFILNLWVPASGQKTYINCTD